MAPEALHDAAKALFETVPGQIVLDHLNKFAGADRDRFHQDPYVHAYNAGRMSVIHEISRILKDPEENQ